MAIASAVKTVEVATGSALPEKVVQFVKMGFRPSEFAKGHLFVKSEHLIFFKVDVQEYLFSGIYQNSVFTDVATIRRRVCVLDSKFQRVGPGCVEAKFALVVGDSIVLIKIRHNFDTIQWQTCSAGNYLALDKEIILHILRHSVACLEHKKCGCET